MFDIGRFLTDQATWSLKAFGPGLRTVGICNHIRSELVEVEANPDDLDEWIDVLLLAFDATWRLGATPEEVSGALIFKQAVNFEREWGPVPPEDEPSFHISEEQAHGKDVPTTDTSTD